MATSIMTAVFPCRVGELWSVVTNLEDTSWRSGRSRVEVLFENHFAEYAKSGSAISFTVTAWVFPRRWAINTENGNMSGHWAGLIRRRMAPG